MLVLSLDTFILDYHCTVFLSKKEEEEEEKEEEEEEEEEMKQQKRMKTMPNMIRKIKAKDKTDPNNSRRVSELLTADRKKRGFIKNGGDNAGMVQMAARKRRRRMRRKNTRNWLAE